MTDLVVETLGDLGWKYSWWRKNILSAQTPLSFTFRGGGWEFVLIEIVPNEGIGIRSQSFLPLQFFDFGKNKDNVEEFIEKPCIKSLNRSARVADDESLR